MNPTEVMGKSSGDEEKASAPKNRNEALEMAIARGKAKAAGISAGNEKSTEKGAADRSQSVPVQKPKSRNEALEMALARGKAKAGLDGDSAIPVEGVDRGIDMYTPHHYHHTIICPPSPSPSPSTMDIRASDPLRRLSQ